MSMTSKRTETPEPAPSPEARVLLMAESPTELALQQEILQLPPGSVEMCSDYLELLLRLEHESYRLVVIFEGEHPPAEWPEAISQIADASNGTPVLLIKKPEKAVEAPPRPAPVN